jgi:hypothetical protein
VQGWQLELFDSFTFLLLIIFDPSRVLMWILDVAGKCVRRANKGAVFRAPFTLWYGFYDIVTVLHRERRKQESREIRSPLLKIAAWVECV